MDSVHKLRYRRVTLPSWFDFQPGNIALRSFRERTLIALMAIALSCLFFGGVELVLLSPVVREGLGVLSLVAQLAPCLVGHLVPYAAACAGALLAALGLSSWLQGKYVGLFGPSLGAALLASPYLWSVAEFAFSGPRVAAHPERPLFVAATFLALVLGCWVNVSLFLWRARRVPRCIAGGIAWAVAGGLLLTSSLVLPNEYGELHRFLAVIALILAVQGGLEIAALVSARANLVPAWVPLAVALALGALVSTWVLATSEVLAWLVWNETAGSRYLTERWSGEDEELLAPSDEKLEKPQVGNSSQEATLRQLRRLRPAPHIIVFSIDNLQADRVGAYGYSKNPATPNIDRLARKGALFRRAYTLFPGTRIFMTSMLSGRRIPAMGRHYLPPQFQRESLTRMLKQRDYHILVKGVFELTAYRDFDFTDYAIDTNLRRATPEEIRKSKTIPHIPLEERFTQINRHLKQAAQQEKPAFVWIHLLGPHRFRGGFVGSKDYPFGRSLEDKYDSTIAGTEAWIPRLEELVQEHFKDDGREVLWVIQSDHGAGMSRASTRESGKTLFEDQVHVPLILSGAGIEPGEHDILVDSAVDVSATVLDLAGIEPPPAYDGVSLVPYLQGRVQADAFSDRLLSLRLGDAEGAILGDFKYIGQGKSRSLFDLRADPLERRNLADQNPRKLKELRRRARRELKRQEASFASAKAAD